MEELKTIEQFFNTSAKEYGATLDALNWGSKRTQELRFHILSEIAPLEGKSILDVGCGFGDFFYFLQEKLHYNINYTGVDISSEIVKEAREKYPTLNIKHLNILEETIEAHDYVFGSGIHNLKLDDNYGFFSLMLEKMYALAKEAVGTNFIYAQEGYKFDEHIFAYELEKILPIVQKITPYSLFRSDYLPHDMTLFLYKKDWATRHGYNEA